MSARGVKGRSRKQKVGPDNPAQSARFIEGAKALGVDETGKAFVDAIDRVLPKPGDQKKKGG